MAKNANSGTNTTTTRLSTGDSANITTTATTSSVMLATSIGTEKKNAWISVRSAVERRHDVADRELVMAGEVELVEVAVDGLAQVVLEVDADLGAEVAAEVVGAEAGEHP